MQMFRSFFISKSEQKNKGKVEKLVEPLIF